VFPRRAPHSARRFGSRRAHTAAGSTTGCERWVTIHFYSVIELTY